MDINNLLFRCSSLGYIMTEPMSKADKEACNLSETAKGHLVDVFIRERYGRQTDISNKFIEKGLMVEEDSITLYSRHKKHFFKKNEDHLKNDFIMGTPDLYRGTSIQTAEEIIDIKSSWDIFTFFRNCVKKINTHYYWQLQGYMALTGAPKATLAYCLVSTPESFINDEKRKVFYKMNITTEDNEIYQAACQHLELAMVYDDIPIHERVIEFDVERDDKEIERLYTRIAKCRDFIVELDERFNSKNNLKAA